MRVPFAIRRRLRAIGRIGDVPISIFLTAGPNPDVSSDPKGRLTIAAERVFCAICTLAVSFIGTLTRWGYEANAEQSRALAHKIVDLRVGFSRSRVLSSPNACGGRRHGRGRRMRHGRSRLRSRIRAGSRRGRGAEILQPVELACGVAFDRQPLRTGFAECRRIPVPRGKGRRLGVRDGRGRQNQQRWRLPLREERESASTNSNSTVTSPSASPSAERRPRFILGGYSQGAQVIGETYVEKLSNAERDAVVFNVLPGIPTLPARGRAAALRHRAGVYRQVHEVRMAPRRPGVRDGQRIAGCPETVSAAAFISSTDCGAPTLTSSAARGSSSGTTKATAPTRTKVRGSTRASARVSIGCARSCPPNRPITSTSLSTR